MEQPVIGEHVRVLVDRGGHNNVGGPLEAIEEAPAGMWVVQVAGQRFRIFRFSPRSAGGVYALVAHPSP